MYCPFEEILIKKKKEEFDCLRTCGQMVENSINGYDYKFYD